MDNDAGRELVSDRNRPLLRYGAIMPFSELPLELQEIIQTGNVGVYIESDLTITPCNVNLERVNLKGRSFWYGEIPVEVLKELLLKDCRPFGKDSFQTFEEYHNAFMQCARGRMLNLTCQNYPVALWPKKGNQTFNDGYGRFHKYVELGMPMIPALAGVDRCTEDACR